MVLFLLNKELFTSVNVSKLMSSLDSFMRNIIKM